MWNQSSVLNVARVVTTGQMILVAAVGFALFFGAWRAFADGRFRGTHRVHGSPRSEIHDPRVDVWAILRDAGLVAVGGEPAARATLLQFSSAFCAPCRATRRVLDEVVASAPGVDHLEVDAEHHLELVRTLGILRTPTTLILDASGREVARAQGAPGKQQVEAAIGSL